MLDIKWIRQNPQALDYALRRRGMSDQSHIILEKDALYRSFLADLQKAQEEKNTLVQKGKPDAVSIQKGNEIKKHIQELEEKERKAKEILFDHLSQLPNVLKEEVPEGLSDEDNKEMRRWGTPVSFSFEPKAHFDLKPHLMDFQQAALVSGSRFVFLKGELARLERGLASFMLDCHTQEFGYEEISPPFLVRDHALFGTGQLPKFSEDLFQTTDSRWLIPTAEVPLTNIVREKILTEDELPLRYTAYTPCFRSEAGAAGKDTRGMIRMHQFNKVELVSIVSPEQSHHEFERMISCVENVLQKLDLPYRVVSLCAGDMGFSAEKTYDFEVWVPSQKTYREISSCSSFGAFQARRMHTRLKRESGTYYPHTLNGSALAVGRCLVAVMENHQNVDGSINIPQALKSYV